MANNEKDVEKRETTISVYKWLKIAQSIMLVALGVVFIMAAWSSEGMATALPISLGVVFTVYGLMELVAGYYLHRTFLTEEVLFGVLAIAFAIVLFTEQNVLDSIFATMLVAVVAVYAIMLIVFGVDRCIGKDGVKKDVKKAVGAFIGSGLLIVADIIYLVFCQKESETLNKWMIILAGVLLVVVGVVSFVNLIMKVRNTKKMLRVEEAKHIDEEMKKEEDKNIGVKVIDISELKKENRRHNHKKILNHQTNQEENKPKNLGDSKDNDK